MIKCNAERGNEKYWNVGKKVVWKPLQSFDAGTVGPNIHRVEEEEEVDYEGQGECGFLRALQVIARHRQDSPRLQSDSAALSFRPWTANTVCALRLAMRQHAETEVRQLAVPATRLCLSGTLAASWAEQNG